jgi:superfamily I DNA/RNA helicase
LCKEKWGEGKKILLITYNKKLKEEVKEKANRMGINILEIHTYHSLFLNSYDEK